MPPVPGNPVDHHAREPVAQGVPPRPQGVRVGAAAGHQHDGRVQRVGCPRRLGLGQRRRDLHDRGLAAVERPVAGLDRGRRRARREPVRADAHRLAGNRLTEEPFECLRVGVRPRPALGSKGLQDRHGAAAPTHIGGQAGAERRLAGSALVGCYE